MSGIKKVPELELKKEIELQNNEDLKDVETLLDLAFGEDRFSKAAYGLRDGIEPLSDLSFIIRDKGEIIATLRFWPIKIKEHSALLLGPIAIKPDLQGLGYGIALMKHGLKQAKSLGHSRVVLVGDEAYYKRVGFCRELAVNISMAGQDEEHRLLAKELALGAFDKVKGLIQKDYTSKNCL